MIWPYDRPCWWLSCWWLSANPCLIYVDRKACLPIVILSVFIIQRQWWWGIIIIITFIHLISLQFLSFLFTCWWRACLLSPNSRTREWFCLWQKGMRNYASIMEVLILLPAPLILSSLLQLFSLLCSNFALMFCSNFCNICQKLSKEIFHQKKKPLECWVSRNFFFLDIKRCQTWLS